MNLVDSSGWLEYYTGGNRANDYAPYLEEAANLITPAIVIFEVYKWIRRERSEEAALLAVG